MSTNATEEAATNTVYSLPASLSLNDGSAAAATTWKHVSVALPPMAESDERVVITATLDKVDGAVGLANVRFSTSQRCSPR
jgi:hypothetical protein